jgi:hypothetical protein
MQAISDLKEQSITDAPLLLFDCVPVNGQTEHWSTHAATVGGTAYVARVLQHSAFDIQTASDQGVDGSPRISVVLANADSHFSEVERSTGWKGATLTVSFVFYDLRNNVALTDPTVVFQGICNPPDQIKESTFRLAATNRMNLQRLLLPNVRIQRRCPWDFPATAEQRAEAVSGGTDGKYSLFYNCGYSPDQAGGCGTMNGNAPFSTCAYNRQDCQARGMWKRFGGLEFVPPAIAVRTYGKDWSTSAISVNQARYNDFVPMVYGTAWYEPLVAFARNDGNLTRMEVLLGVGQMQGVLTVLVNDYEIPLGVTGTNMTGTGWYNVNTLGTRDGAFDMNFTDGQGNPSGDPYGSMAYLSVVVPNQINNGNSLPTVQVLVQGLIVPVYGTDGTYTSDQFSNNPAWILLDILRRSGWEAAEIDIPSFAAAAAYCDQQIDTTDLNGNPITVARFQCNLALQKRRSASDVIRGIRNTARLYLTYGAGGILQLEVENTVALQQPSKGAGSNSTEELAGGWPVYEFGDGSTGSSGILRQDNGTPTLTLRSRAIADTPNCLTVEFQDALNSYQQDSYSVVDVDDVTLAGQQVTSTLMALGIPNYDQAARILQFNLDKSVRGNVYVDFQTSVKGFGIRPGDVITVTYLKEGFTRQPFRVLKISPATNYRTATITAQIHDDSWYADSNGQVNGAGGMLQPAVGIGTPLPLIGSVVDANGQIQFGIEPAGATGGADTDVLVSFTPPTPASAGGPGMPLVNLLAAISTGGTLKAGQVLYYAVSGLDSAGQEGPRSFAVQAPIPADQSSVTISGLSFSGGTASFNVYRGRTPAEFLRIAAAQAISDHFTDTGLSPQLAGPPDPNFDHANFYWRMEQQPEVAATVYSATSIGNGTLQMAANAYRGMIARITRGTGAGQEQTVAANDSTSLNLMSPWVVAPDATSFFVVAEAGWHFAALSASSPVQFTVPDLAGEVVQVTGRAANVNDVESAPELAIVTRWQIGGTGSDTDVPPAPSFGLGAVPNGGSVVLSGVSFQTLTNTQSISSATLTLHYWDELLGTPATQLASPMAAGDSTLTLNTAGSAVAGNILQIEGELLEVTAVANGGTQYTVTRAIHGTTAAAHAAQLPVFQLLSKTVVITLPEDFFGSPYAGGWDYAIPLPDVRVASAELFVTNQIGNGPSAIISFMNTTDYGLRSLSGGQYSIQVEGYLAVDQSAAPAIVVETARSVRDVSAVLGTAADSEVDVQLNLNGAAYCTLTFQPNQTLSAILDGGALPPLPTKGQITLSVLTTGATCPGADLTVLIRL